MSAKGGPDGSNQYAKRGRAPRRPATPRASLVAQVAEQPDRLRMPARALARSARWVRGHVIGRAAVWATALGAAVPVTIAGLVTGNTAVSAAGAATAGTSLGMLVPIGARASRKYTNQVQQPVDVDNPEVSAPGSSADLAELSEFLGRHPDVDVVARIMIARHPACAPGVLDKLSLDSDPAVRCGVIENPRCPSDVVSRLSRDSNANVRLSVARRPDTAPDTMTTLASDRDLLVSTTARTLLDRRNRMAGVTER